MSVLNKIQLLSDLFKSRLMYSLSDGRKNGYMPAYKLDPYRYRMHKIQGGNFNDYSEKEHLLKFSYFFKIF
jgi:hypothetical protein